MKLIGVLFSGLTHARTCTHSDSCNELVFQTLIFFFLSFSFSFLQNMRIDQMVSGLISVKIYGSLKDASSDSF
jgi:uncharacterized membrane protein